MKIRNQVIDYNSLGKASVDIGIDLGQSPCRIDADERSPVFGNPSKSGHDGDDDDKESHLDSLFMNIWNHRL